MIKNYFKTFIRSIKRNKVYSLINIFGLAVGIACAVLLYLYIQHELGYNLHYKDVDRIYRVEVVSSRKGIDKYHTSTAGPYGPTLKKDYSEVEAMVRIQFMNRELFDYNNKKIYEENVYRAGPGYFEVFEHKFIKGNPKTALKEPNTIVLTRSTAKKVFGRVAEALNKTIKIHPTTYRVTAIVEDVPDNSDLRFHALMSFVNPKEKYLRFWGNFNLFTYIKLRKGVNHVQFEKIVQEMRDKYMASAMTRFQETYRTILFPLTDIHLYSSTRRTRKNSGILYILIFSTTAIFILLIACVNYMNLATARSVKRAKEVGIRKVVGSYRGQLIQQFLFEAFFTVMVALIIGLVLVELTLPFFNALTIKELSLLSILNLQGIGLMLLVVLLVSIVSGSYPAFVLSGFKPALVLKGKFGSHRKGVVLRKGLVVFQFAISITMIISTWMVYQQLRFIHNKDVGYAKDQVVALTLRDSKTRKRCFTLCQELMKHSQIVQATPTTLVPNTGTWANGTYRLQNPDNTMRRAEVDNATVGANYLQTMGIQLIAGRNFTEKTEKKDEALVNETMVKMMGWKIGGSGKDNPIGKLVETGFDKNGKATLRYKVIGVVKDFHLRSLHNAIEPLVLRKLYQSGWSILVRVNLKELPQTMAYMKKTWEKTDKIFPFRPMFLDQNFARQYRNDERRGTIFYSFSILTIFIACLGLFGLVSFTVQQRTKEIGIRKVLGASEQNILRLISRDFVFLVLIANLIAFPAAFFVVDSWLQSFAYRTSMSVVAYFLAGGVALLIAIFTISLQALRATKVNPVNVLKYE